MKESKYYILLLLHAALGVFIFLLPAVSILYSIAIIIFGTYFIIKNQNRNNEVLFAAGYIVGSEVFLRMTGGVAFYEFSKYAVIIYMSLGIFYSGFSKNALPLWGYILLLIPGIIIATETLNLDSNLRTRIAFNLSGPVCLGIASIYTYNRKIQISQINELLLITGLPIISTAVYLIFYTPELKTILNSTQSNYATSGGFGPNQVATVLGLGMFIFFSRLLFASKSKISFLINLLVTFILAYRGLLTFSRGGMLTGFIMILMMLLFIYLQANSKGRYKLKFFLFFIGMVFGLVWLYTSYQTEGLIDKRYANQDAKGRVKESRFSGREKIAETEIDAFLEHPFWGIGVGKAKEYRAEELGEQAASHNEITRILAEHGALGITALLILIVTPIILYLDNRQHIYMFSFLVFWLLTINHAAMRIAAPAFVYSLALMKVNFGEFRKMGIRTK